MRNEKEEREEFYSRVAALTGTEPKKGDRIQSRDQQKWQYGFGSYPQSPAVVIHTDSLRYAEEWHIGWREKTLEDGPDGNKLFAGWEVVSNRNDNTNGGWWKAVDAILLTVPRGGAYQVGL